MFNLERDAKKDVMVGEVEAASNNNGYLKQEGLLVSSCDNAVSNPASVSRMVGPTRRSTKGGWTEEEDKILAAAVKKYDCRNWRKIAECVPGRTNVQCLHRWQKVLNPELVKGPWRKEEDDLICELVAKQGNKKWAEIARYLPGRMGKQCRERWHNHLNPDINRDAWTKDEELILIREHEIYGNRWAEIAKFLKGRTENSIKNHWNCSVKKRLEKYGVEAYNYCTQSETKIFKLNRQKFDQKMNSTRSSDGLSLDLSLGRRHVRNCQPLSLKNRQCNNGRKDETSTVEPVVGTSISILNNASDISSEDPRTCESNTRTIECGDYSYTVQHRHSEDDVNSLYLSMNATVPLPLSFSSPTYPIGRKNILHEKAKSPEVSKTPEEIDHSRLCYQPLQLKDLNIFLETGEFPSTDSFIRGGEDSVSSSNQQTGTSPTSRSPEYILKNAAKSFKSTPSIVRRRMQNN